MSIKITITALAIVTVATAITAFKEEPVAPTPMSDNDKAVTLTGDDWSQASKLAIEEMKKKYGEPHEKTASMMVWYNNGPWKRTIVYAKEIKHDFPTPHSDVIEQCINYKVPLGKFCDLAGYDGSVTCNRTNGEISARCDKEVANILAINLANDIVMGIKDVQKARDFYAKTIKDYMKGQVSPYMMKFQFDIARGGTSDPDETAPVFEKKEKLDKEIMPK